MGAVREHQGLVLIFLKWLGSKDFGGSSLVMSQGDRDLLLPEVWMAVVDELSSTHADDIYEWMIQRPECPQSVAGQIFWLCDPTFYARQQLEGSVNRNGAEIHSLMAAILDFWRTKRFQETDLGFKNTQRVQSIRNCSPNLLVPAGGKQCTPIALREDFDFHCIIVNMSGLLPRPREEAIKD